MSGNGSATRNGPGNWADENTQRARELLGRIRRMAVKLTSRSLWQVIGHILLDNSVETRDVEVFTGVGFYARPKDNGRSEAIVFFPNGGAGHPVAIATRDEDTRKKVAKDLKENETQMHNGIVIVRCTAAGKIEARSASGTATEIPTKADLQVLRQAIIDWVPVAGDGGSALKVKLLEAFGITPPGPAWPACTTKFKAE